MEGEGDANDLFMCRRMWITLACLPPFECREAITGEPFVLVPLPFSILSFRLRSSLFELVLEAREFWFALV